MGWLYTLAVRGYSFFVRIASLWNPKAKKWIKGRRMAVQQLANFKRKETPVYWFHCASLGEFEQGRPIMERLKAEGDCQLVITFFSPSGYEIRKNYELADLVMYLPQETKYNVNQFLAKIKPHKVFFIKYEFWAAYIFAAKKQGAEVYSISAVFREKHIFFKWYGGYMRNTLKAFSHIFVQDKKSQDLLKTINVQATLAGDTRYDRVMKNASAVQPYLAIEKFIAAKKVLVIGSSWQQDEAMVKELLNSDGFDWQVIIAPHEIDEKHIQTIESVFTKPSIRYSQIEKVDPSIKQILIIDNIGMLMNVYQYADVAYVGGALGNGLHNILEPACFGVPVIFGTNYSKFIEAYDFIENGIGFTAGDTGTFSSVFHSVSSKNLKEKVLDYMKEREGATDIIHAYIYSK